MTSQTVASQVNIKDYFIDKSPGELSKPASTYEVILQNNTDFIIARKTAKTYRELVILISRGLFYFKEKEKIEEISPAKLKTFLRDLQHDTIELNQVLWLPVLCKDTMDRLDTVISDETLVEMCRHNVLKDIKYPHGYKRYWEQNQNLFMKLHSIFPTICNASSNKYYSSLPIIFELDKRFGYNEAMYFAEILLKTGIDKYTSDKVNYYVNYDHTTGVNGGLDGFLRLLDEPYNLSLRRLIEYIFFDAYTQGISNIDPSFWRTYEDYLSMQIKIFGKIKEKYPKHLKTEHDILALKVNMMEVVEKCENFAERSGEVADLAYKGKVYSIIVPDTPRQIADEGINLSHCVGSYVDKIINGDCHILFMRKSHSPDESLVTLQFCKGRINQAEGLHRRVITTDERKFLDTWGKEKDVQIAA